MTKKVRIENADTNLDKHIVVEIWEELEGTNTLIETVPLKYPTSLYEGHIWSNRFLIVRESKN